MIALANHRSETTARNQGQRTIAELTKTVSASRLSTWQRCRLQFYFRYVAGIQKSPTPGLHIGTTVHTVLQQWNLARWHGRELEIQELEEIFSRAWIIWQEGEQIDWEGNEETVKSATWDLVQLYLRETPIAPDEKPEAVEVGVEADLSGHGLPLLVGVIDLVRSGGRIVDFKTSARKPDVELLAHTAETQTTSYGLLYREATGAKENGIEFHAFAHSCHMYMPCPHCLWATLPSSRSSCSKPRTVGIRSVCSPWNFCVPLNSLVLNHSPCERMSSNSCFASTRRDCVSLMPVLSVLARP
jgi:hypothetical protein